MQYVAADLPGSAEGIVRDAWYLDSAREHRQERVLPLPWTELIVNLSEPYLVHTGTGPPRPTPQVFLTGVRDRAIGFDNPKRLRHIAVRLELWAPALLGLVPGDGVTGVPERLAWAVLDAAGQVPEVLTDEAARTTTSKVVAAVLDTVRPAGTPVSTVRRATGLLATDPTLPLAGVAARVGVSHKTLIAHFRAVVGCPPSRIARILLLHDLVARVPADGGLANWAALVADSGFADQSHFIRVFRQATGMNPRSYLRALAGSRYDDQRFLGEGPET